jgi:hypothetical protein
MQSINDSFDSLHKIVAGPGISISSVSGTTTASLLPRTVNSLIINDSGSYTLLPSQIFTIVYLNSGNINPTIHMPNPSLVAIGTRYHVIAYTANASTVNCIVTDTSVPNGTHTINLGASNVSKYCTFTRSPSVLPYVAVWYYSA